MYKDKFDVRPIHGTGTISSASPPFCKYYDVDNSMLFFLDYSMFNHNKSVLTILIMSHFHVYFSRYFV